MTTKFKIGDLVLVNETPEVQRVFTIDGVLSKIVSGHMTVRYESGNKQFHEETVIGRVTIIKTPAKRRRRTKKEIDAAKQTDFLKPAFPTT